VIQITKDALLLIANKELQSEPFYVDGLLFEDIEVRYGHLVFRSNQTQFLPIEHWEDLNQLASKLNLKYRLSQ
jgi:hypothetical protein